MEKPTSVLILCSNRILKESITRILNKRSEFQVIAPDSPAPDFRHEFADAPADVVLLDSLHLLGEESVFLRGENNSRAVKCVLVAMEDDQTRFLTAIRLGALGYVLQEATAAEVIASIRAVAQGEAVCPARYARVLFDYFASQSAALLNSRARAIWTDAARTTAGPHDRARHDQQGNRERAESLRTDLEESHSSNPA